MSLHHSVQALTDNVQKARPNHDKVMILWNLVGPTLIVLIIFLAVIIFSGDAHAAANSSDWVKQGTSVIDVLKEGFISFGGPLLGLAIIGYALWGGLSMNIEWRKVGIILFAGFLIAAGPALIQALMDAAK